MADTETEAHAPFLIIFFVILGLALFFVFVIMYTDIINVVSEQAAGIIKEINNIVSGKPSWLG